ncbi:MAG: hypothetical protein KC422_19900 [Trueperaceae bacterium]|nr:hypothetical protein [Trueperaceae bacterium]
MFNAHLDVLEYKLHKYEVLQHETSLSFAEVIRLWQKDEIFQDFFSALLQDSPFKAFRWETPAIDKQSLERKFEFVLLDSPGLSDMPDRVSFAEHFEQANSQGISVFENLGGDAVLVVPAPLTEASAYAHLADFIRNAPERQKRALWSSLGFALEDRLSNRPLWLSTAGGGVAWLHVRLDSRPKYYHYAPYRQTPEK